MAKNPSQTREAAGGSRTGRPDIAPRVGGAARPVTYFDQVKFALETLHQRQELGKQSPLAAPYFLGGALAGAATTPGARGDALAEAIEATLEEMWHGPLPADGATMLHEVRAQDETGGRYDCLILELNYFRQRFRPAPRNQAEIYHDVLNISRPTHDRHLRAAIERLGARLLQRLRPATRLEQPVAPPQLIGRIDALATLQAALANGEAVSLLGAGGMGKTSLAATVAARWQSPVVFWYTFRPTLNDRLESLLFALGHCFHIHGASSLWRQLVAEGGNLKDVRLGQALAVDDLATLQAAGRSPLLCFDEMDFLRPLVHSQPDPQHTRILEFLDSLIGQAAMLCIGQRGFWQSHRAVTLEAWSPAELGEWLRSRGFPHTVADLAALHDYTVGNPRLAELCLALQETAAGQSLLQTVQQLPRYQALLPLWVRLASRLPLDERLILQALSVFRTPAPADVWRQDEQDNALAQLHARRLVQLDERGGVTLLPTLREVIYEDLTADRRDELHGQAAEIRAARGEFTAAAYHLITSGRTEEAIALWYPHRTQEIHRGEAGAALAQFERTAPNRLSVRRRKELLLLRAELYELLGDPQRVLDELAHSPWTVEDAATPEAALRRGQALEAQSDPVKAREAFQLGLDAVAQLLRQGSQLHVHRSLTYLRQRETHTAWREAQLAHFHAEIMLGVVAEERGDYPTARHHYGEALSKAQMVEHSAGIAQTNHYLAILAGRDLQIDAALAHFQAAIDFYSQVGDRVNLECVRGNLASTYIQSRQFEAALEPATLALRFFQSMGHSFRIAQNASNLAEAYAELGNADAAQHYAELTLEQEEPHSHPYALYTLGTVARTRGDWEKARIYYDESRKMAEANEDKYLAAFCWRALGEVMRATGDLATAHQALQTALTTFIELEIADEIRQTETLLTSLAPA